MSTPHPAVQQLTLAPLNPSNLELLGFKGARVVLVIGLFNNKILFLFYYLDILESIASNASESLELSVLTNPVSVLLNKALKIINLSSFSTLPS